MKSPKRSRGGRTWAAACGPPTSSRRPHADYYPGRPLHRPHPRARSGLRRGGSAPQAPGPSITCRGYIRTRTAVQRFGEVTQRWWCLAPPCPPGRGTSRIRKWPARGNVQFQDVSEERTEWLLREGEPPVFLRLLCGRCAVYLRRDTRVALVIPKHWLEDATRRRGRMHVRARLGPIWCSSSSKKGS